jgi:FKBP-type peptidyl-prolyl cis-trans isomerase FklB
MKCMLAGATSFAFLLFCGDLAAQQPGTAPRPAPAAQPGQPTTAPAAAPLTTPKQKASYGIGLMLGSDLAQQRLATSDLDFASLVRGIADSINGGKPALDQSELRQSVSGLLEQVGEREFAKVKATPEWKALADKNKKAGDAFLAANKAKEGVQTLPSGLQYKVIKAGSGPTPGPADAVVANYKGVLTDGTEFDSSSAHGGPATFSVNGVIKGWTEALQKMKVGDKWQLVVPSELAYGERGMGDAIGPNSVLVFDIELVNVQKPGQVETLQPLNK